MPGPARHLKSQKVPAIVNNRCPILSSRSSLSSGRSLFPGRAKGALLLLPAARPGEKRLSQRSQHLRLHVDAPGEKHGYPGQHQPQGPRKGMPACWPEIAVRHSVVSPPHQDTIAASPPIHLLTMLSRLRLGLTPSCAPASPSIRCFPLSDRCSSGSPRFAKSPSPLRHRLARVNRHFPGLTYASSVKQGGYLLPVQKEACFLSGLARIAVHSSGAGQGSVKRGRGRK